MTDDAQLEYVLRGTVYLISDRRLPDDKQGWISSHWKGKQFPLLFTSRGLVNGYIDEAGKLEWMVIDVIDTPTSFLGFIQVMGSDGCKHLGINKKYKREPEAILPLSLTLKSLKKMLAEMN